MVILVVSLAKITTGLGVKEIRPFFGRFLPYFEECRADVISNIENGKTLSDDDKEIIVSEAKKFLSENNV